MKDKEAHIDYKEHQLVLYVEREDGTYGPMQTGSYISKNYIDDYWLKRENLEKEYRARVEKGEITPIEYYMVIEELSVSELAARVKLSSRAVKMHMIPKHFAKMSIEVLKRYADVFDVPIVSLLQAIIVSKNGLKISLKKTDNPLFVLLKIDI